MPDRQTDVAVIGGGPAGYVAAIRAAQLGGSVVVIEKEKLGGVCLNWGCVPTKTLMRSCEVFSYIQKAKEFGITVGESKINLQELMARKNRIVARLTGGIGYLLKKNKIEHVKGHGKLIDSSTVKVCGDEESTVKTKNIIIATGSHATTIPIEGVDKEAILTSTEALQIEEIPENLLIIGAGAIGVEFAHIYSTLGSKVTMVEMLPHIIPGEDSELSEDLKKIMEKKGITILTQSIFDSAKKKEKNYLGLIKTSDGIQEVVFDKLLVSIGRKPCSENLGLEEIGIEMDQKGWIKVDSHMQTTCSNVYAAGDVVGGYCLAHVASIEGEIAAENAMGKKFSTIDYRVVPRFVCSLPEIAAVGLTEKEATEQGYNVRIGKFPFSANAKAMIYGEVQGMVKVVCNADTRELLGMHILGPQATDLILEGAFAINLESTCASISDTIHPHPALGEVVREAILHVQGRAVHM